MSRPAWTIGAIAIGLVLNAFVPAPSVAQYWPTRPITLVVQSAAGGASDVIGRILNLHLSEILRQQVIIENIGGAGGMIGAQRVAKAAPDGYQFLLGNAGSHAQNQTPFIATRCRTMLHLRCLANYGFHRASDGVGETQATTASHALRVACGP